MLTAKVELREMCEETREGTPDGHKPIPVTLEITDNYVAIEIRNGNGDGLTIANVMIELERGRVRALVWDHTAGEGNGGDPTDVITLVPDARKMIAAPPTPDGDDEEHEADL